MLKRPAFLHPAATPPPLSLVCASRNPTQPKTWHCCSDREDDEHDSSKPSGGGFEAHRGGGGAVTSGDEAETRRLEENASGSTATGSSSRGDGGSGSGSSGRVLRGAGNSEGSDNDWF